MNDHELPKTPNMTIEEFNGFFDLFPKGSLQETYNEAKYHILTKKTEQGDIITFELITNKWREYIKQCSEDKTNEKYVNSFQKFIQLKKYNHNFNVSLKNNYLNKYK